MRDRISSHSQFDHERYWRFSRNSGLPHGYFSRGIDPDTVVFWCCVVLGVVTALLVMSERAL